MICVKVRVAEGIPPPVGNPFKLHCTEAVELLPDKPVVVRTGLWIDVKAIPEVRLDDGFVACGVGRSNGELVVAVMWAGPTRSVLGKRERFGEAVLLDGAIAKVRFFLDDGSGGARVVTGNAVKVGKNE